MALRVRAGRGFGAVCGLAGGIDMLMEGCNVRVSEWCRLCESDWVTRDLLSSTKTAVDATATRVTSQSSGSVGMSSTGSDIIGERIISISSPTPCACVR